MHKSDLKHNNPTLEQKLEDIFALRADRARVNWSPENYHSLLEKFGNPHKNLPPIIHVAGTNGKGSTVATLRSILEAQGLKAHVYTSPHLIKVNERIVLAGKEISDAYLEDLIDQALEHNNNAPISFFELLCAIAFKAFSDNPADILLLETGLGGRLDCTNIIENPLVTIITCISMDHMDYLGNNIEEIAAEKSGIIKPNTPCILGNQGNGDYASQVIKIIQNAAQNNNAILYITPNDWSAKKLENHMIFTYNNKSHNFALPALTGEHQIQNTGAALAALFTIKDKVKISNEAINKGLQSIIWRGRLQQIPPHNFSINSSAEIWLDSGHNDSAGEALANHIKTWESSNIHLVIGMLDTKCSDDFLKPLLPLISSLNIVPITSEQGRKINSNINQNLNHIEVNSYDNVIKAIKDIALNNPNSIILVAGSLYLAGEVLRYIDET